MISVDKDTTLQILGCLLKNPYILSQTDKYIINTDDFHDKLDRYLFSVIYNLYMGGMEKIGIVDIENYMKDFAGPKAIYDKYNGAEYLQDAVELSKEDNFQYYYTRFKKLSLLRQLQSNGYNIEKIYCENPFAENAAEINENFEELTPLDILSYFKKDLAKLENNYTAGTGAESKSASSGIRTLFEKLKESPDVGCALQGKIFNTVTRGARRGKYYLRSGSSGFGKTRAAVGDACYLSYPIRFNTRKWGWEIIGSAEKTLFIATEQEEEDIQTMILSYLTGFNEEKLLEGNWNSEEEIVYNEAMILMEFFSNNLIIKRIPEPNIENVRAAIRNEYLVNDIDNVFYDYIFSTPSLLGEFRDLRLREDVVLRMLSTALKDLAVEMNIFVMSSTQVNSAADGEGAKGVESISGSKAIIEKADFGCIASELGKEELDLIEGKFFEDGLVPNQVIDVYKMRRGRLNKVRIWSYMDLGNCRCVDLFITNKKNQEIEGFHIKEFVYNDPDIPLELKEILRIGSKNEQ